MRKSVFTLLFLSALGTQSIFAQTATEGGVKYCLSPYTSGALVDGVDGNPTEIEIKSKVTLSDGNEYDVLTINDGAFKGNTTLQSVKLPEGLEKFWDNCFNGCTSLKSITIPASVKNIYNYVFYGSGLESITFEEGSQLQAFGEHTFDKCANLSSIKFPSTMTDIGKACFLDCTSLESLDFSELQLSKFKDEVVRGCTSLKTVKLPSTIDQIWDNAFYDCSSLESIVLPNSLKDICNSAFENSGIKSMTFPVGLETIRNYAFKGTPMSKVVLPPNLIWIGNEAFLNTNLEEVVIPASVRKAAASIDGSEQNAIGTDAFGSCKTVIINSPNISLSYLLARDHSAWKDLYLTTDAKIECQNYPLPNDINIHVLPSLVDYYTTELSKDSYFTGFKVDSKMKVTFGENQEYASFSSKFNLDFNAEGLKAYKGAYDADKNAVVLTQVQKVSADKGVVLKGESGKTYEIDILNSADETDNFEDNLIKASTDATWLTGVDGGDYVLSNGAFHPIAKEGFLAAGRAYLPLATITGSTSAAKELTLSFGNATGINAMTASKADANNNVYFNVAGVKASQPMKGLNISNGKKFYNK